MTMKWLMCRLRGHAEARFVMLPEFFGLYRYSRIECRRCGATIELGYKPTDEEVAAYNVWAEAPIASPSEFLRAMGATVDEEARTWEWRSEARS